MFKTITRIMKRRRLPTAGALIGRLASIWMDYRWKSRQAKTPSDAKLLDILEFLKTVGVTNGATLFVHAAWKEMDNGSFRPNDLINELLALVGTEGTVAMPAFPPHSMQKDGATFNQKSTPSGAGIVAEIFRRYPGVTRSINLNHSVCALGPKADFLTSEHHLSETAWDEHSPYYRLREIPEAWIVGLGVGHKLRVATSLHCVESVLRSEIPYFQRLFGDRITYTFKCIDGSIGTHEYLKRTGEIYTPKIANFFSNEELIEKTVAGLEVYAIKAAVLIDKAVSLGRSGKTMYVWPLPLKKYFKNRHTKQRSENVDKTGEASHE